MQKWFKHNLTLTLIITLLIGYGTGAAFAAVIKSDVERLKAQILNMPDRLAVVETKVDYIARSVERIETAVTNEH